LEVNGLTYHVEENGSGPALLLLHGFTGSGKSWNPLLPGLTETHRVITVDFPGHGVTSAPTDPARYTIENTAADLAAILEKLEVEQTAVLGYSLGGRVALFFALRYPARVAGLILESASPGLPTERERAERKAADEALARFIEEKGLEAFVERWENLPLWASQTNLSEEVRANLRRQRLHNRPDGLANSLRGLGTGAQPSLWEELENFGKPVLILSGELDPKFTLTGQLMEAKFPAARRVVVAGAGHTIHLEKPDEFEKTVKEFLAGL
jgi:2-succinyl-6-hydroxy-2,4-cyclohexadiene-1-carboxylate synthase